MWNMKLSFFLRIYLNISNWISSTNMHSKAKRELPIERKKNWDSFVLMIDIVVSTIIGVSGFRTNYKYRHSSMYTLFFLLLLLSFVCVFVCIISLYFSSEGENTSIKRRRRKPYGCKFEQRRYFFYTHTHFLGNRKSDICSVLKPSKT